MPFVEHKPGRVVAGDSGRTVDPSPAAVLPGPPPGKTMVWVPGGTFAMGSHDFYPEERPVHRVSVDGFWMDEHPVTVAEFRRFAKATGYVTVAERPLDPANYPEADPALLVPGSLVFRRTWGPVNLNDYRQWWAYVPGATWPVGSFPPNGYGLYDMAGNVWEWTCDYFTPRHPEEVSKPCCVPHNPRVAAAEQSYALGQPGAHIPRKVIKGGSHLCAPTYCLRYRPAARQGETVETSTGHIGFRCIGRVPA